MFILDNQLLGDLCSNEGIEISSGTWHTVISRQESSALLEVKEGSFVSKEAKEFALSATRHGSATVDSFLAKCHKFSESDPINF